jgi:ribosomal-protein-alanine N-acetyltransferase
MDVYFSPMDEDSARQIALWQYDPPWDVDNIPAEKIEQHLDSVFGPANTFYCMREAQGHLCGYVSLGDDGQVPGGDYGQSAIDIGMGIRPELTGKGNGEKFVVSIIEFIIEKYTPDRLRVTIAEFNPRAQKVWRKNKFQATQRFIRVTDGMPFILMTRTIRQA